MADPVLILDDKGLYCPAGGFHIDPWQKVERAVVTHAHADHARGVSTATLMHDANRPLLARRLPGTALDTVAYGVTTTIGRARVTLHPAGHILGSAQVEVDVDGDVWVVTGDCKARPDPTTPAFAPVRCRVLVTESTFALPVFRFPTSAAVVDAIGAWWQENQAEGQASLLFAYSMGKAQRILGLLAERQALAGPVVAHSSVLGLCQAYAEAGVGLPALDDLEAVRQRGELGRALVLAPPQLDGSAWAKKLGPHRTAFASGWMLLAGHRRRRGVGRGFALSDHGDWDEMNTIVAASGADTVLVTHGFSGPFARFWSERGKDARPLATRHGLGDDDAAAAADAA